MSFAPLRPRLLALHRWLGLIFAPVFLVMILSGAVLSFRPIVAGLNEAPTASTSGVDIPALEALVGKLDINGAVTGISVAAGGAALDVASSTADIAGSWTVADATRAPAAPARFDVFGLAERVHKQLALGLGFVVDAASFAMLAIMLIGPFLSWLRFRNSLIGWHRAAGWLALPITIISPLTAVLMVLGIGGGGGAPLPVAAKPVTISEALTIAAPDVDLSHLVMARKFRGGTVMLATSGASGGTYAVTDTKAVALTGGPGLVKQIHEGTWAGAWSGALNFLIAMILFGLTVTGFASWFRRWRRERRKPQRPISGGDVLVAHASQTGTATRLAEATARVLAADGLAADVAALGALDPERLATYREILVIASTTGEGDVPDPARGFVKRLAQSSLTGVSFAMLALGDRSYARYCGGAETLSAAMRAAGATETMAMVRADGDPAATWSEWMRAVRTRLGTARPDHAGLDLAAPGLLLDEAGRRVRLRLAARRRMDDPNAGDTQETWSVSLASESALAFRPGDLLRLVPSTGSRPRSYSIGSSSLVDPRHIDLTIRLHRWQDQDGLSGFGAMSGQLIKDLPLGAEIEAELAPHPAFNPPADPAWPIIMIGAGSGIAPFPGFLAERAASGRAGPAWLVFGNRHRAGDFLWSERFAAALTDGSLDRLDTAFSRDADDGAYVQSRLRQRARDLASWILDKRAVIYVCGKREMADGVLDAISQSLVAASAIDAGAARDRIEQWIGEGRIRIDVFD